MSQSRNKVKVKLEIKGSPKYKFEYEGPLGEALDLVSDALAAIKKHVLFEEETI